MPYALPVAKAVRKIAEHAEVVKQHIGRPLHECSIKEIKIAVADALRNHPDFANEVPLNAVKDGEVQYSSYEIAHRLLVDQLISKLKHEGKLADEHAPHISNLLGALYYNKPPLVRKRQLLALSKLKKHLGTEKTNVLLREMQNGWNSYQNERFTHEEEQYKTELADMFSNPKSSELIVWLNFVKPHESPVDVIRAKLKTCVKTADEKHYKSK